MFYRENKYALQSTKALSWAHLEIFSPGEDTPALPPALLFLINLSKILCCRFPCLCQRG